MSLCAYYFHLRESPPPNLCGYVPVILFSMAVLKLSNLRRVAIIAIFMNETFCITFGRFHMSPYECLWVPTGSYFCRPILCAICIFGLFEDGAATVLKDKEAILESIGRSQDIGNFLAPVFFV